MTIPNLIDLCRAAFEKMLKEMVASETEQYSPEQRAQRQRAEARGSRQIANDLPKGVSKDPRSNRYNSKIKVKGRLVWLGTFDTKEEAAKAWKAAAERRNAGLDV